MAILVLTGAQAARADDQDVIDYRQLIMKQLDAEASAIGMMVAGQIPPDSLALEAVRDAMIESGLARSTVNERTRVVKRMFKWAVRKKLVPAAIYGDLLTARREWPALRNFTDRAARLFPEGEQPAVLQLLRGGRELGPATTVQAYFNLTAQPQPLPVRCKAPLLFTSEAKRYGGSRGERRSPGELLPFECVVFGQFGLAAAR